MKRKTGVPALSALEEIRASQEKWKADHPIIRSEYRVVEFTPDGYYEDEYGSGHWTQARDHEVSDWFDSVTEATRFMADHEPEPGHKLRIQVRDLRYMPPIPASEKWFPRA